MCYFFNISLLKLLIVFSVYKRVFEVKFVFCFFEML